MSRRRTTRLSCTRSSLGEHGALAFMQYSVSCGHRSRGSNLTSLLMLQSCASPLSSTVPSPTKFGRFHLIAATLRTMLPV